MFATFRRLIVLAGWLTVSIVTGAYGQTPAAPELNLTLGEQRVKFAPTRSFQEMRLDVVNSVGEVVFTHTTTEAEFDWNLRASNNESLTPGLYRYALTLKFSEDLSRQHTGHFIVEKGQDQIWLTANEGTEVSGTTLNAARSGGRSIAGVAAADDKSVKRDVTGRETIDEKGNKLTDKQKNARSEKASLLGTAGRIAKFQTTGSSTVIDSVVTESATGNIGIGTTTPDYKLDVEHGGGTGIRVKSTSSFSVVDIDAFSGDAALRFARAGVNQWNIRNDPSTDNLQIFELGGGGSRMVIQNTTGNLGLGTDAPSSILDMVRPGATDVLIRMANSTRAWSMGVNGPSDFWRVRDNTAGAARLVISNTGLVGIGTTTPTDLLSVNGTASKPGGGSWAVFSDERLKDIKGRYTTGWQALRKLQPIRFEYKADNALGLKNLGETIGFSAQAVAEVIPEAVSQTPQGYLQLNQDPILWTMLNAVKEQQAMIQRLLKNNRRLSQRVAQLERQGRKQ